jgi:hypothetical protein
MLVKTLKTNIHHQSINVPTAAETGPFFWITHNGHNLSRETSAVWWVLTANAAVTNVLSKAK